MKTINLKKITITGVALLGLGTAAITATNLATEPNVVQAASSKIKVSQNSAVKKFKAKFKAAKVESISLDKEKGRYVYEIEGFNSTREYEMKINAATGKVISSHSERLDRDERNKKALNLSKTISRSTATKIAQKRVSGKAVEWSLDREGSKNVWEVTISKNVQKSEVKINAITKKVISVERD